MRKIWNLYSFGAGPSSWIRSSKSIENTDQNSQEGNQQQTDVIQGTKPVEEVETTPQLFSEEENVDSFKQEINLKEESKSLIKEDEEEDFEIPAFLRKQKI